MDFLKTIFGEKLPANPENKSKKLKFTSFGNCQAQPIAQLLLLNEKFSQQFEFVPFPKPVYMLTDSDYPAVAELVSSVDLFVQQSVGQAFGEVYSTENLNTLTKPSCQIISFPSIYFSGYNPEISYLRLVGGSINEFSDYHDINLINKFLSEPHDVLTNALSQFTNDDFYTADQFAKNAALSFANLRERENNAMTKSADFIEEHWLQERLFFSMNHPSRKLLGHIAKQMHQLLGVKPEQNNNQYEYLGESILPIYRAVSRHLSFDGVENVKMRGKVLSIQDYIARHIDVYRQIDGAKLKHNLLYVKKQGEAIFKELITAV